MAALADFEFRLAETIAEVVQPFTAWTDCDNTNSQLVNGLPKVTIGDKRVEAGNFQLREKATGKIWPNYQTYYKTPAPDSYFGTKTGKALTDYYPLPNGSGTGNGVEIVQEAGQGVAVVMSQKATTDYYDKPTFALDASQFEQNGTAPADWLGATIQVPLYRLKASFLATLGGGSTNTTPAAPTFTADDEANTLAANHALGTSEILISENNGAYVAYAGAIAVGDVERAAGYWKAKIKAATGRNESAVANSPAFTVGIVTPALQTVSLANNNGQWSESPAGQWNASGGNSNAQGDYVLDGDGWFGYGTVNGSFSGALVLGLDAVPGLDNYTNFDYAIYMAGANFGTQENGTNFNYPHSAFGYNQENPSGTNRLRIRRTGSTFYGEVSTDSGATWQLVHTYGASFSGRVYLKFGSANAGSVVQVAGSGLTAI